MKPMQQVTRLRYHARLLRTVIRYRIDQRAVRVHDWIADHFIGLIITVFMGVLTPLGLLCLYLGLPPIFSQFGMALFFVFIGIVIFLGGKRKRDTAGVVASAEYERYKNRRRLRRQYPNLRRVPDSMVDDLFQPHD